MAKLVFDSGEELPVNDYGIGTNQYGETWVHVFADNYTFPMVHQLNEMRFRLVDGDKVYAPVAPAAYDEAIIGMNPTSFCIQINTNDSEMQQFGELTPYKMKRPSQPV